MAIAALQVFDTQQVVEEKKNLVEEEVVNLQENLEELRTF
jgi:hypothetical protein